MGLTWGPPADGKKWEQEVRWRAPFLCACGYYGWEYWNQTGENTFVCTKCGRGRLVPHDSAVSDTPEETR